MVARAKPAFEAGPAGLGSSLQAGRHPPCQGVGDLLAQHPRQLRRPPGRRGPVCGRRAQAARLPFLLRRTVGLDLRPPAPRPRTTCSSTRRLRWPERCAFEVREVAVQGAIAAVARGRPRPPRAARRRCDEVDVIVVARGGRRRRGPPPLLRRAPRARRRPPARTPHRSSWAIGHEGDSPCWTWSPTTAPRPRRTRLAASCRTAPASATASPRR